MFEVINNFRLYDKVCIMSALTDTPYIPNCKSLQESWRVKAFSRLTKIIEKNTKICNVKWVYYENIIKEEYNDT